MVIEEHARLKVTLPDGREFDVHEDDIIKDSLSTTSQCVNGNTFGFGCVSPAQLSVKFRLKSADIGRYDVYGAEIILYSYFGNTPPDGNGKRGVFNVTSVTKNNDIFTVSASDNICWLDNSAFSEENSTNLGNAVYETLKDESGSLLWNAVSALGQIIGEVVGDNIKLSDIVSPFREQIPNGSELFKGYGVPEREQVNYPERRILLLDGEQSDNVRDYVAWLVEYMGGFIVADKNGNIEFKLFESPYYHKNPEILDFSEFQQNTLEIAGFRIYLYSAKIITEDNYCRFSNLSKLSDNSVINVETVIKNNPFVEFSYKYWVRDAEEENKRDLSSITGTLMYYQHWIQIRPFSAIYHGNKYLHLGQYIKIKDENGTEHETTITNITWKFRGGQQIKCVGEDSRTLSQARKRSQAVRMGERMKTQINRLEDTISKNNEDLNNKISSNENDISGLEARIKDIENEDFKWHIDRQRERIEALENSDFQWQIDNLRERIENLESGG